jgi:hypothetical protein
VLALEGAGAPAPGHLRALPAHEGVSAPASARVLAQPALALFLALHASEGLHNLTLIRLVELALVLRGDAGEGEGEGTREGEVPAQPGLAGSQGRPAVSPRPRAAASGQARMRLDWGELVDAAEAAGALRFVFPAFTLCERLLPDTVPPWVLARCATAATPAQRRVLASLEPATAQRLERLSLEERFMWAGTPAEHVRRLLHGAWPAPAGRSAEELGRIYAERAWRLARGRVVR